MAPTALHRRLSRRQLLKLGGLFAAAAAASACRAVAPSTAAPGAPAPSGQPTSPPFWPGLIAPTATSSFAAPESVAPVSLDLIALNRLGYGPRPGDIEAFWALPGESPAEKLAAYVEAQLHPDSIDDAELEAQLAAAGLATLNKPASDLWREHIVDNGMTTDEDWYRFVQPVFDTQSATFLRAVFSRRQLYEVLVDFWHNHFNVYCWHESVAPMFLAYDRDVIRPNVLGNFRAFLEAVATSPSMLYYLDNYSNHVAGPNENYARELFELHTLGTENYLGILSPAAVPGFERQASIGYVDNDIYEAARCFTGWRVGDNAWGWEDASVPDHGLFYYHQPAHDRFNKLVLGRYLPADQDDMQDGRTVLGMLAAHPGTAHYVCGKLCRRLVADTPPESLVQAAADVFMQHQHSPDQLRHVTRVIALSPEFQATWGEKFKRPLEAVYSAVRAVGAEVSGVPEALTWFVEMIGQPMFGRRPPDGYPDRRQAWSNTMTMLGRWNFSVALLENWMADERGAIIVDLLAQTPPDARTADSVADYWIQRILGRPMQADDRAAVAQVLDPGGDPQAPLDDGYLAERLPGMVELILMSPDFQLK